MFFIERTVTFCTSYFSGEQCVGHSFPILFVCLYFHRCLGSNSESCRSSQTKMLSNLANHVFVLQPLQFLHAMLVYPRQDAMSSYNQKWFNICNTYSLGDSTKIPAGSLVYASFFSLMTGDDRFIFDIFGPPPPPPTPFYCSTSPGNNNKLQCREISVHSAVQPAVQLLFSLQFSINFFIMWRKPYFLTLEEFQW
jgi:hypothetical protein